MSTAALVVSVVVTLLVYWIAEEYAEVVGEQVERGRLRQQGIRPQGPDRDLADGLRVLRAAARLVLARVAGASDLTAANVGLVVAVVLLDSHGWLAA